MHFRDRECVRTLRPLFVYATEFGQLLAELTTSKRTGFEAEYIYNG